MSSAAPAARPAAPGSRAEELVRGRTWELAVYGASAVWTALMFVIVRDAFHTYRLGRFDLGNMVQAVSGTADGRFLEQTDSAGEQMVRLGSHADPFLALLAPLWILWPSPLALAFAQIAVVAAGAIPLFWLGRRHLGSDAAAGLLALGYLAYPWIATSALGAIHPVTFAITFLLFAVWALDTERFGWFALFAVLTMSTGELMGLPIVGIGIWYALARGRRRTGAVISAAGVAWTLLAVFVVVPAFAGHDSAFYGFYDQVGGSPQGVLGMLVTDPLTVLGALVESHDIVYVVWLGLPLLGLFLLSPGLAAVALPQLLANTLSDFRSMSDPRYHSVAAIVPFLFAATVFGVARLRPTRRRPLLAGVLVCCAAMSLVLAPWPRLVGVTPLGGRESVPAERVAALDDAVAVVPDGVPVSASNTAALRLSDRRYVYSLPVLERAEWVVVDLGDPWVVRKGSPILSRDPDAVEGLVASLRRDAGWQVAFDREGVVVFRKV